MPDGASTETTVTSAQGGDTPTAGNVSDGTSTVAQGAATSVTNGDAASQPAATRSDDTRGAGYDLTKLLDNLDSLPERVANAVREAAAPATPNPTTAPATHSDNSTGNAAGANGNAGNGAETATRSRGERFAGWWFGQ